MIQPADAPYVTVSFPDHNGNQVTQNTFQVPYVVRTYYGGTDNEVSPDEAAALQAAGYVTS